MVLMVLRVLRKATLLFSRRVRVRVRTIDTRWHHDGMRACCVVLFACWGFSDASLATALLRCPFLLLEGIFYSIYRNSVATLSSIYSNRQPV